MTMASTYRRGLWVGSGCLIVGTVFAINALLTLQIGSSMEIGPGYFPISVSILFALLGLVIAIKGLSEPPIAAPSVNVLRPLIVLVAIAVFGLTAERFGLVTSLTLSALIASMAALQTPMKTAVNVVCLVIFCVLVFSLGLGLNIKLF